MKAAGNTVYAIRSASRRAREAVRDVAEGVLDVAEAAASTTQKLSETVSAKLSAASVEVLEEKVAKARRKFFFALIGSVTVFAAFICGGALIFALAEDWDYIDAVYFCVVTASTVGYGDIVPETPAMKTLNIVYIGLGTMIIFANFSSLISSVHAVAAQRMQLFLAKRLMRQSSSNNDEAATAVGMWGAVTFYLTNSIGWLLFFSAMQVALAIPYMYVPLDTDDWEEEVSSGLEIDNGLLEAASGSGEVLSSSVTVSSEPRYASFGDALYFSWITSTTVGYGITFKHISPLPSFVRPYIILHIILSISLLGGLLSHFSALSASRTAKMRQREVMSIELTEDMINDMDRDGDGVDKLEFVVGLLTRLDVVHWHDVKPLLELFEKFDRDNSGKLTAADVVHQKRHGSARPPPQQPAAMAEQHDEDVGRFEGVLNAAQPVVRSVRRVSQVLEGVVSELAEGMAGDASRACADLADLTEEGGAAPGAGSRYGMPPGLRGAAEAGMRTRPSLRPARAANSPGTASSSGSPPGHVIKTSVFL